MLKTVQFLQNHGFDGGKNRKKEKKAETAEDILAGNQAVSTLAGKGLEKHEPFYKNPYLLAGIPTALIAGSGLRASIPASKMALKILRQKHFNVPYKPYEYIQDYLAAGEGLGKSPRLNKLLKKIIVMGKEPHDRFDETIHWDAFTKDKKIALNRWLFEVERQGSRGSPERAQRMKEKVDAFRDKIKNNPKNINGKLKDLPDRIMLARMAGMQGKWGLNYGALGLANTAAFGAGVGLTGKGVYDELNKQGSNEDDPNIVEKHPYLTGGLGLSAGIGLGAGAMSLAHNQEFSENLKNRLNPNRGNTLFGEQVARRAREKGIVYVNPDFNGISNTLGRRVGRFLKKFKPTADFGEELMLRQTMPSELKTKRLRKAIDDGRFVYNSEASSPEYVRQKTRGAMGENPSWQRTNTISDRVQETLNAVGDDKFIEAKHFRDIPATRRISEIRKTLRGKQKLVDKLHELYPDGWVAKRVDGASSLSTRGGYNPYIFFSKDDNTSRLNALARSNPDSWAVQPDMHLQKINPLLRKFEEKFMPYDYGTHSQMKEYRVHAVNGKVIPYATKHRGSKIISDIETLLPWRTSRIRAAERAAQEALDKVKNKGVRKGMFGFDVAFDKNNKPVIIETNPSGRSGASGYVLDPAVVDATEAAIKGKLPYYIKARRAIWGALAAGGLTLGAAGIKRLIDKHRAKKGEKELAANQLQETVKTAMTFGATRNLLRQLRSQGVKVTRDPRQAIQLNPNAPSVIPKKISNKMKQRYAVDTYGSMIPGGTNQNPTASIFVPRRKNMGKHLEHRDTVSPRSTLFHEAGHSEHYLEDPRSLGGYYANPRGRFGVRGKYNANAKMLMIERIAERNAMQRLQRENVPQHLQDLYKTEALDNYAKYLKDIGHGRQRKYLEQNHPALVNKTNPLENL